MVAIYGFTLLRNGLKYDYCFLESLNSLSKVTEKIYLALGASDDGTEAAVANLPNLKLTHTVWDDRLREGGLILSDQTNVALNALRADHGDKSDAWGIYLQADEVFHEEDYELIQKDLARAQAQGCDAMSFRYLHFWQTHHHIAINKKWYPQEIRAIKLGTKIESWGDAQSFRHHTKIYESDARVFHYGHVRDPKSYQDKKADILKLYHSDEKLPKYKRRERRFDNQTECLVFWGNHPAIMKDRILRLGDVWAAPEASEVYIKADRGQISDALVEKINARKINWVSSMKAVPKPLRAHAIILNPNCWERFRYDDPVPRQMRSKLARPWTQDFILMLKLSDRGIGLKA